MKRFLAVLAAAALVGTGAAVAVAGPASAHTPSVASTCSVLTVTGTSYETKPGSPEKFHYVTTPAVYKTQWKYTLHGGPGFVWVDSNAAKYVTADGAPYTPVRGDKTPYYERTSHTQRIEVTPEKREKVVDAAEVPADPTPNTVTVTIDGKQVASEKFGTSYSNTFNFSDQYTAHDYTVSFVGWNGLGTRTISGTSTACVKPDVPVSGVPSIDVKAPTCEAPTNTLTVFAPEGTSIEGFPTGTYTAEDIAKQYGLTDIYHEWTVNVKVEKGYKYSGPATLTFVLKDPGNQDCRPLDATATVNITTDATCTVPGIPAVTAEHASLVGELNTEAGEHTATFTADEGHKFADGSTELTVDYTVPAAIGNQTADPTAPCFTRPDVPKPDVKVGEWTDQKGETSCDVDYVMTTRTTTTTPYIWDEDTKAYVEDTKNITVTYEDGKRDKTDAEKEACATPPTDDQTPPTDNETTPPVSNEPTHTATTPAAVAPVKVTPQVKKAQSAELAYTGSDGLVPLSIAALILLLAGTGLFVAYRRKARKN